LSRGLNTLSIWSGRQLPNQIVLLFVPIVLTLPLPAICLDVSTPWWRGHTWHSVCPPWPLTFCSCYQHPRQVLQLYPQPYACQELLKLQIYNTLKERATQVSELRSLFINIKNPGRWINLPCVEDGLQLLNGFLCRYNCLIFSPI
jgi:hypothetical protein